MRMELQRRPLHFSAQGLFRRFDVNRLQRKLHSIARKFRRLGSKEKHMTALKSIVGRRPAAALCPSCKICGATTAIAFAPMSKKTGHPIPDAPDDCPYFECTQCGFCFSTHLDNADHTQVYDEAYWTEDDPDWTGKIGQTLRLVLIANAIIRNTRPNSIFSTSAAAWAGSYSTPASI